MSAPAWLDRILGDRAFVDLGTVAGRQVMAEAILEAIPKKAIAAVIAESALAVLESHHAAIPQQCGHRTVLVADVARELGNNAAQTVLLTLEEP